MSKEKRKYNSKEEYLEKEFGITPTSKHHNYDYLYKSMLEALELFSNLTPPQVKVTDEEIDQAAIKFCNEHCEPKNGDLTLETEIFSAGVNWALSLSASLEKEGEGWISVEDERPEIAEIVNIVMERKGELFSCAGFRATGGWYYFRIGEVSKGYIPNESKDTRIIKWRELPSPPSQEKSKEQK